MQEGVRALQGARDLVGEDGRGRVWQWIAGALAEEIGLPEVHEVRQRGRGSRGGVRMARGSRAREEV